MPRIGPVVCLRVRGPLPPKRPATQTWTVPGVDGVGRAVLGTHGQKTTLTAVRHDTAAGLALWEAALIKLTGMTVDVVTDQGNYARRVFIESVSAIETKAAFRAGCPYTHMGTIKIKAIVDP